MCLVRCLPLNLLFPGLLMSQVVFTEVMFYPDTLAAYTEYVEIHNAGNYPVDLSGWRVGDSLDLDALVARENGLILAPGQYGIILDPGYFTNATIYDPKIPDGALVLTIEDARLGRYGLPNNRALSLLLVNALGDTVQIMRYRADNRPGYSEEKIRPVPDNAPSNWGNSRVFRGTPGMVNSLTPRQFDLALVEVGLSRKQWPLGTPIPVRWVITNQGLNPAVRYRVVLFWDEDGNARPSEDEVFSSIEKLPTLLPEDTLEATSEVSPAVVGFRRLGVGIDFPADEDTLDNVRIEEIFVEDIQARLVVNEIMFQPRSGRAEWVEIYNPGNDAVNLMAVRLADLRDTVAISSQERYLPPGNYLVLAEDSAVFEEYLLPEGQVIVVPGFPTLNNDVDELSVISPAGRLLDRVRYFHDWYGREVDKGTSLEKLHPLLTAQSPRNWAASVDPRGATPGERNSVFVELLPPTLTVEVHPNPFSPNNDGFEDFTIIQFEVPVETALARVVIYDMNGRLIRVLAREEAVAHHARFVWDGRDDQGRMARTGIYLCLIQVRNIQRKLYREVKTTVVLVKK